MEHYAGIDVSLELSSVCIVDATGRIMGVSKTWGATPRAGLVGGQSVRPAARL
jgi:hypothetical protein